MSGSYRRVFREACLIYGRYQRCCSPYDAILRLHLLLGKDKVHLTNADLFLGRNRAANQRSGNPSEGQPWRWMGDDARSPCCTHLASFSACNHTSSKENQNSASML